MLERYIDMLEKAHATGDVSLIFKAFGLELLSIFKLFWIPLIMVGSIVIPYKILDLYFKPKIEAIKSKDVYMNPSKYPWEDYEAECARLHKLYNKKFIGKRIVDVFWILLNIPVMFYIADCLLGSGMWPSSNGEVICIAVLSACMLIMTRLFISGTICMLNTK